MCFTLLLLLRLLGVYACLCLCVQPLLQLSISGNSTNATFVRRDTTYSENTTKANITMISAGFNYTITVRARTSVGLGAPAIALARTDAGSKLHVQC